MNAHHAWWNSKTVNSRRADELVKLMEENNFSLITIPDTPTYFHNTGRGTSTIDLTFESPAVEQNVTSWRTNPEAETGSDHAVIMFDLISDDEWVKETPLQPRRIIKKANWEIFRRIVSEKSSETAVKWKYLNVGSTATQGRLERAAAN